MYYSPILFTKIANIIITNLKQFDKQINYDELNKLDHIIILCLHNPWIEKKLSECIQKLNKPFVIISAMEDAQFPLEFSNDFINTIEDNKYFKHWYMINKTIPNNEYYTSIPYGLDYWTLAYNCSLWGEIMQSEYKQNEQLLSITNNMNHFTNRIPMIYSNYNLNLSDTRHGGWRKKLIDIIPKNIIYYQPYKMSRTEMYKNMINYSFVLSPFGNGFDCIRTFEALCCGCIVIMKKSFLDIIYEDLPVLLVDEWTDINEELLIKTLIKFNGMQFKYDKLKMDYYYNLVTSRLK